MNSSDLDVDYNIIDIDMLVKETRISVNSW